jgi:hypothetical protein
MTTSIDKVLGAVTGVGVGLYIIQVVAKGNTKNLYELVKDETGYLEFLIALYVLYLLHKFGPTSKITDALIVMAVIAVLIKAATHSNLSSALSDFAAGRKSMFQTLSEILGIEVK